MSETANTLDTTTEIKAKEDKEKKPKAKEQDQGPDPYCCTPPGDGGGPDTKP